ncbi:H-type lectin domain-containing protein [Rhodobacteraceae bacterium NNCM2]|nr:H-type lectin domain-containing protein [Coraliihabitans acroporae]
MSVQHSIGNFVVESGNVLVFDHIASNGPMWSGDGERLESADVTFERPFIEPPILHLSIEMIDADNARNLRLQLRSEDVRREGFRAIAFTWSDTRIGRLSIAWMAIGRSGSEWDV